MADAKFLSLIPAMVSYLSAIFFTLISVLVILPACFGREIGIRRLYINMLMKVFAWGSRRLEGEEKAKNISILHPGATDDNIIRRENSINHLSVFDKNAHKKFELSDVIYLIKSGIEAVIQDDVTKRFRAEELPSWNLLTRSDFNYNYISVRLTVLWFFGLFLRYFILFPMRFFVTLFALLWMVVTLTIVAYMPESSFKRKCAYRVNVVAFRIVCRALSAIVKYHDRENLPQSGGICVANHTTVLDAVILMQDRPYAILGQVHGGFLGWFMRTMAKASKHVWFERSETRDRQYVSQRILSHVRDPVNYPVLLFPEGTCINNSAVMMFKKGSFEIPTTVYPVAIKYNPWFGDAFWNSSKHSMLQYLAVVMTSWAIVADVWYLPAMKREPGENAMQFAERVKSAIARKGGLVDCVWDGQLKRMRVKDSYLHEKQRELGHLYGDDDCQTSAANAADISGEGDDQNADDDSASGSDDVVENIGRQRDDDVVGDSFDPVTVAKDDDQPDRDVIADREIQEVDIVGDGDDVVAISAPEQYAEGDHLSRKVKKKVHFHIDDDDADGDSGDKEADESLSKLLSAAAATGKVDDESISG